VYIGEMNKEELYSIEELNKESLYNISLLIDSYSHRFTLDLLNECCKRAVYVIENNGHYPRIFLTSVSKYKFLDTAFIEEYKDYLNWTEIFRWQRYDAAFVEAYKSHYIDYLEEVLNYYSNEDKDKWMRMDMQIATNPYIDPVFKIKYLRENGFIGGIGEDIEDIEENELLEYI
jgi:hypothetical protein